MKLIYYCNTNVSKQNYQLIDYRIQSENMCEVVKIDSETYNVVYERNKKNNITM